MFTVQENYGISLEIDKWDFRLINILKQYPQLSYRQLLYMLKDVWAERCRVSLEHVKIGAVFARLLTIIDEYDLATVEKFWAEFLNAEMCLGKGEGYENFDYALMAAMSILINTEVDKLPGYGKFLKEYENKKLKNERK